MIAKIAAGGSSFRGAFKYYLHDKGKDTRERVAWTHTENLLTDDPDKAWKVMAWTTKEAEHLKLASGQKMTGRKLTKPVFSYSLAWAPDQDPDQEHMLATAKRSIEILGFGEHETIIVSHRDLKQKHLHVVINRVHPLTGLAADTGNSKLKLSDFALEYERENGKILCPQREENHRKRSKGEKTQYRDQVIAQSWEQSDNGRGFIAALTEKGYHLAQGRKRLVVVDRYGQTHNPTRHLENVRAKDLQARLRDIDLARLPNADKLSRAIQADNRRRYDESLQYDERITRETNALQNRHIEQRARLANHFEDRLSKKRDELGNHYGFEEQKTEIEALREKASKSNWFKNVLGISKRQRIHLQELEMTYRNAQWRADEQLATVNKDRDAALAELQKRQKLEAERSTKDLEAKKPATYVNDNERARMAEVFRQRQRGRSRDGPSHERD